MPTCDYCDGEELVYELGRGRGSVRRCIECLAIEQGKNKFRVPFDRWIAKDEIEPSDHSDDPVEEPFDPRAMDYRVVRSWFTVLARLKDDEPIVKRNPESPSGNISEETREFLTNVMGSDAHKRPSELRD
jgi:hypothetical protein